MSDIPKKPIRSKSSDALARAIVKQIEKRVDMSRLTPGDIRDVIAKVVFDVFSKFNPNHGPDGRFSSGGGSGRSGKAKKKASKKGAKKTSKKKTAKKKSAKKMKGGEKTKAKRGGGGGGSPKEAKPRTRAEIAKKHHNPATKEKQDLSEEMEVTIAKKIGAKKSGDNKPMDVVVNDTHGAEVKMLHDSKQGRVKMRRECVDRKKGWAAEKEGRTLATIAVDGRDTFQDGAHVEHYSGHRLYYREGVGNFPLKNMTKVKSWADLKKLIRKDQVTMEKYGLAEAEE